MVVIHLKSRNRLSWRVGSRGISRSEAIARADENILELKAGGLLEIDRLLLELSVELSHQDSVGKAFFARLYRLSDEIGGMAAVFGYPALGEAAYSLCDLLCHFEEGVSFSTAAVKAHLDGMAVLRTHAAMSSALGSAIVTNLRQLVVHVHTKHASGNAPSVERTPVGL